jgi:hypothetical protein
MSDHLAQQKPLHPAGGTQMDELLSVEEAARRLGGL